jgi:hypothetical protein
MRLTVGRLHSRALLAVGAAALIASGLGVWLHARQASDGAARVLTAAPGDAWLILTVDVAAAWPLLEPLVGARGGLSGVSRSAGLGPISDACGFEPLEHVRQLMVALPEVGERGERGDFGVAFDGDFSADGLAACARRAIAANGGTPGGAMRGDFALVSDQAHPSTASLAYRPGGPFLVGRGAWLDAMIDAVDGRAAHSSPAHDALRHALTSAGPRSAPGPAALVVTALLPRALRDRVAGDPPPEAADASSPDPAGRGGSGGGARGPFASIRGVRAAGLSVVARGPSTALGPREGSAATDFDLELRCDTPGACDDVKELIERERLALSGDLRARLIGLGPLIDGLSIEAGQGGHEGEARTGAGDSLSIRTRAPTGDLARMLGRLFERFRGAVAPVAPGAGEAGAPSP